jgi:hypothetical protein
MILSSDKSCARSNSTLPACPVLGVHSKVGQTGLSKSSGFQDELNLKYELIHELRRQVTVALSRKLARSSVLSTPAKHFRRRRDHQVSVPDPAMFQRPAVRLKLR